MDAFERDGVQGGLEDVWVAAVVTGSIMIVDRDGAASADEESQRASSDSR